MNSRATFAGLRGAFAGVLVLAGFAASAVAQERAPAEDPRSAAARYNAQLGIAYLKQNDVTIAREKIERALAQNPRDPIVQSSAGLLYERLNDVAKADRAYSAALRLAPKNPDYQNNYAVFQCRRGEFAKGQKLFEQAASNPEYATPAAAYTNAGVCARSAKDLARAEDYFRKALKLVSDYPDALLQMADLSFARGNGLASRAFLQRYFVRAPSSPDALLLAIRVERSLGDVAAANDYETKLRREFPASEQARQLGNTLQGG